jgi:hypothetical protein
MLASSELDDPDGDDDHGSDGEATGEPRVGEQQIGQPSGEERTRRAGFALGHGAQDGDTGGLNFFLGHSCRTCLLPRKEIEQLPGRGELGPAGGARVEVRAIAKVGHQPVDVRGAGGLV